MTDVRTVLVHVDFHEVPTARVAFATDVAKRFGATLLGVSACQLPNMAQNIGREQFARFERHEIEEQLEKLRATFAAMAEPSVPVEWRGFVGSPTRFLADVSYAADVIVASSHAGSDLSESDVGDLAIIAGRPVLSPVLESRSFSGKSVVVAWRNTREARRAVHNALPFLHLAEEVTVISCTAADEGDDEIDGLVAYLGRHGIASNPLTLKREYRHVGETLVDEAQRRGADLVVAGAYGHSRLRELAFGGVTRDLLHQTRVNVLLTS